MKTQNNFLAKIYKIGINPYVLIPAPVLNEICKQANKNKGPIPVRGELNGHSFIQTLVKYAGKWRLYMNGPMRKGANADVGDIVEVEIKFDPQPRKIEMHAKLKAAFVKNTRIMAVFSKLPPSRQKEIIRYMANLKTKEAVDKNVNRVIGFLSGRERFVGRDKP